MRIGIDAHSAERDGTGNCTYTRNLLLRLGALDSRNHYVLFVTDAKHPFYQQIVLYPNFEICELPKSPAWFRVFCSLAAATYRKTIDVLHVQYFAPLVHRGVLVCTIHDLASYRYPGHFSLFERVMFRFLLPLSARKARKILTASGVSKNDLVALLGVPESKIAITYCGVSDSFSGSHSKLVNKAQILEKYRIKKKFLLSVGRIDPRKNLSRLIHAYSSLRKQNALDCQLAIVGKIYLEPASLKESIRQSDYGHDILMCGYVPDEDLAVLYSLAEVFVYTSEYEGFGLPPLEAMAAGTPVVASDIAIFREILGDAAVLVNPMDISSIQKGIAKILSDRELKKKLIEKGLERVKQFQWDHTAKLTLQIFEETAHQTL